MERQDAAGNRESIRDLLKKLLQRETGNLAVLLEMTRLSAKLGDRAMMEQALERLTSKSAEWPGEIRKQFEELKQDILAKPVDELTFEMAYLRNTMSRLDRFQSDFDRIELPPNQVGFLLNDFIRLPKPTIRTEPPDMGLAFESVVLDSFPAGRQAIKAVHFTPDAVPLLLAAAGDRVTLKDGQSFSFPSGSMDEITPQSIEALDYNYDFLNDLAFAGSGGFALFRQEDNAEFTEVTGRIGLPPRLLRAAYNGVWKSDVDLDGDLDLVLGRTEEAPVVLRNNGDGSFVSRSLFDTVRDPVDFSWSDLDGDGDPDAAFVQGNGTLRIFTNERNGRFEEITGPAPERVRSFEAIDLDGNAYLDLAVLTETTIQRIYHNPGASGRNWQSDTTVVLPENLREKAGKSFRLFVSDFDNNGRPDLMVSTTSDAHVWLGDDGGAFTKLPTVLPGSVFSVADFTGDNRLDLAALDREGRPVQLTNRGSEAYNGRIIRPQASGALGDQRINSFGIGGEIEIRSGLMYQKQPVTSPAVHFGLGRYEEAEMLRVIWPNGSVQAEFAELGYGSKIFNEQILKGSCPWVFTHNGERMEFVTDFLWRTALGLRINAQGDASVIHSVDWIKIGGDQLKPKNGVYDIRITAELWETHFFDHVSLMVVDHPRDTDVLVDERFALPPPERKLVPVSASRPVVRAVDQDGRDVTGAIEKKDGLYVDGFELTPYQGLAEEHYIELEFGNEIPKDRPVWLVAYGWVYPTDSSINVAISQGSRKLPHGIHLQIPDEKAEGGWKTVRDDIGFPAGKNKTVLIRLDGMPGGEIPGKVRLTTNMEIYWDRIGWAAGRPETELRTRTLDPVKADLRYRGFSELTNRQRFKPTTPVYGDISGTSPKWIDLKGYYTRFGDVRELLKKIDDRYVIMNAGDELLFHFESLPPPAEGWERSFVLIGDGWVKDGDFNTGFSKTVIPLPYHGMQDYSETPGKLEQDPVYRKHRKDWINYHTRYITPEYFNRALLFK